MSKIAHAIIQFLSKPTAAASFVKCVYVVIVSMGTNQEWQLSNSHSKYYQDELGSLRNCSHLHYISNTTATTTDDDNYRYDSNKTNLDYRYQYWLFFVMPVVSCSSCVYYSRLG